MTDTPIKTAKGVVRRVAQRSDGRNLATVALDFGTDPADMGVVLTFPSNCYDDFTPGDLVRVHIYHEGRER